MWQLYCRLRCGKGPGSVLEQGRRFLEQFRELSGCTRSVPVHSGLVTRTSPTFRNCSKKFGSTISYPKCYLSCPNADSLPSEKSKPPLQLYLRAPADKLKLELHLLPPKLLGLVPECQTSSHHRNGTGIEAQFMCQIRVCARSNFRIGSASQSTIDLSRLGPLYYEYSASRHIFRKGRGRTPGMVGATQTTSWEQRKYRKMNKCKTRSVSFVGERRNACRTKLDCL
jgi:hypothetical protein